LRRGCSTSGVISEDRGDLNSSVGRIKHLEKWRIKRLEKQRHQQLRQAANGTSVLVMEHERRALRHRSTDSRRRPHIGGDSGSQKERGSLNCCALAQL
jgi:hypothetical protein